MKKYAYLLVIAFLLTGYASKANPGDTTWVQGIHLNLGGGGNYDTTVSFPAPGTTYRKIYMIFTLGKYMCPGYNPATAGTCSGCSGWCGDWDYTIKNYLMIPGGDTLELGRLITPYANALDPHTPWTAQQHYIYDVTDYANLLTGTIPMRLVFEAGSGGFTGDVKFAFIEGVPERNALGVYKLWGNEHTYGGTPSINTYFPVLSETAPAGTVNAQVKYTVTGHGSDNNYCCEFQSHNYQILLNGTSIVNQPIWRSDCGANELYPQSGTWLLQRGNWCPGAIVYSNFHDLPGITGGSNFTVGVQYDPYTGSGGGYYITEATLLYHGPMNKPLDASIEQIISPANVDYFFRENPNAGAPVITVRNTGSAQIDTMVFQYGLADSAMQTYTWVGALDSLQDTNIVLPTLYALNNIAGTPGTYNFNVSITSVNGTTDDDSTNNSMTSQLVSAPLWPTSIKIMMRTNNEFISTDSTICETSWAIYDMWGNIVAKRANATISTIYQDTVNLPVGYYKLTVYDSSCDGLNWWANQGTGITSGYIYARTLSGTNLALNGDIYTGTYNNDFGCGFSQYFSTGVLEQTGITNISGNNIGIEAYPNPAQGSVNVEISGLQQVRGTIQVIDALGRVVVTAPCFSALKQVNTGNLINGVYTIVYIDDAQQSQRLTTRLLILK